jgi:hypothetical protein
MPKGERLNLLAAAAGHDFRAANDMTIETDRAQLLLLRALAVGGGHAGLAAARAGQGVIPVDKKQISLPCCRHFRLARMNPT